MRMFTTVLMVIALLGCKPKDSPEPTPDKVAAQVDPIKKDEPAPAKDQVDLMKQPLQAAGELALGTKITGCVQVTTEVFPKVNAAPWKCEMDVKTVESPFGDGAALSGEQIVEALDLFLGSTKYENAKLWGIKDGEAGPKTTGSIGLTRDGSGFYDNYVGKTEDGIHVIFVFVKPTG